jgi:malate dehydrogenase (oxaloacetate-decarboxylating)
VAASDAGTPPHHQPSASRPFAGDPVFDLHVGGKMEVRSTVGLGSRDDLSMAYTPGVARVCEAIAADPTLTQHYTWVPNTVAVVTDGTAVLGLGDIGPLAALPVMEGKAALFKRFADIDAFPICLDTTDTEEIIRTVKAIAPVFAGINLEDISAPRCFEIERRLREELDIPVFHDDQHGTAIVALAALRNALRVVGKRLEDVRLVMSGAGAAGTAILKLFLAAGASHVVVTDVDGVVHRGRADVLSGDHPNHAWIAEHTNPDGITGTLSQALRDADVFVGVSAPNILTEDDVASMAPDSVVFAMANPVPEIDPDIAARHAAVVATGRSDFANQINNVLVFPGVFRGLIDSGVSHVSTDVLLAAANALADVVHEDELNATYIIPSVFHPDVSHVVAEAVRAAVAARDPA